MAIPEATARAGKSHAQDHGCEESGAAESEKSGFVESLTGSLASTIA